MNRTTCGNAESLAGAIALGEATDAERDAYRRHLAGCEPCLHAYGGEREIERVMETVSRARDAESWEPDLRAALRDRSRMRRNAWQLGLAVFAAALVASVGFHALVATGLRPLVLVPAEVAVTDSVFHVALESRQAVSNPRGAPGAIAPAGGLVVAHHVVTLGRGKAKSAAAPTGVASQPAPENRAASPRVSSDQRERDIAAVSTQTAPAFTHQAESIAVTPTMTVRDAAPLGGASAIVPKPPAIAAREMAVAGADSATAVYELAIDERGVPGKCTIRQSSGYVALDAAVCRAAMGARFVPRTIDGKSVASTYLDAFTFLAK
jgi:TonB family protein